MDEILDRIKMLPNKLRLGSVRAFAINIDIPQPSLDKMLKGERKVSLELVRKILKTYPEISAEWLLRGNCELLIADNMSAENSVKDSAVVKYYKDEYESMKARLQRQNATLTDLSNELDSKRAQIEFLLQEGVAK